MHYTEQRIHTQPPKQQQKSNSEKLDKTLKKIYEGFFLMKDFPLFPEQALHKKYRNFT